LTGVRTRNSVRYRRRAIATPSIFAAAIYFLLPSQIDRADIASLIASQPGVAARAQKHIIASPFGTIHAATFSFPRPIGTTMPRPLAVELVALNSGNPLGDPVGPPPLSFPRIDRTGKSDVLVPRPRPDTLEDEPEPALLAAPFPDYEFAKPETADTVDLPYQDLPPADLGAAARADTAASGASASMLFGIDPATSLQALVPWSPGEAPVIIASAGDPDIKQSALDPQSLSGGDPDKGGVSIAVKGEVTGAGRRPKSPAERLNLLPDSKPRAKAERCLANAVYFEARGETVRGQMAVAQVVMNRVFSGYYPNDVCGVVYQNARRHLACQFTFACDGIPDVVTEPDAWEIAKKISRDTLDGKLWMPEVARSTHYHAYWVRPNWIRDMRRILKIGVHTFYRPRLWGDGADIPAWGNAAITVEEAARLEAGRKG
jgi:spore germination cell wall hydrolase CwlJ-like protein